MYHHMMPPPEVLQQDVDDILRAIYSSPPPPAPLNPLPTVPGPSLIAAPHLLVNPQLNSGQEPGQPNRPTRAQMIYSMKTPLPGFLYPVEPTHPVWSDGRYKLNKPKG